MTQAGKDIENCRQSENREQIDNRIVISEHESGSSLQMDDSGHSRSCSGLSSNGSGHEISDSELSVCGSRHSYSNSGLSISGSGYSISDSGLSISGSGHSSSGSGLSSNGSGHSISDSGLSTSGPRHSYSCSVLSISGSGYSISDSGLSTSGPGYSISDSGLSISGFRHSISNSELSVCGSRHSISNSGLSTSGPRPSIGDSRLSICSPRSSTGNSRLLKVKGLDFQRNNASILKGISLEADRGEFIGLIGPNGAGKTTLLKCISGIYSVSGCVELDGVDVSAMSARETASKVAMLHQDTSVAFPFRVIDIVLTGRYHKLGRFRPEGAEDYAAARKYMGYTDTLKLENRMINTLSGGERQRVLFAKALAQETDLILLDEPSASLDIAYEEQIFKYSSDLCSNGKTVIAAVHDLKTAVRYCSRLVLMKDGRIIADGPPESVITRENLRLAYDVNALVYRNRITGFVDFHLSGGSDSKKDMKIHVIGGGGSASGVIRQLFESGYTVTAGVFSHGDSDLGCADVFGIKALACRPFSEIDDDTQKENIDLVKAADLTILCDMPFGYQNIRNLEAASYASSLILIEDGEPGSRDFTGGAALEIYNELKKKAVTVKSARLHEVLP